MAGSIIAGIILGAGASAVAVAVTTFIVNLVLSTVLTKLLSPTPSGGGGGNAQDPGVQSRLPANPANKLGVIYGSAWIKGAVIHGENTSDYKTAYYAVALCENIGTAGYPNSMTSVYWQEFQLTLNGDGWVTNAVDASGASVSSFNNSIRVQYFADGLPANRSNLPNTTWFQTATNTMSGYTVAVITVKYNRDQRIFQLEDMTFNLSNGLTAPGTAIQDYLTNTRYGCALASSLIDTASLTALNTYSAETVTFTPVGGGTATQQRYRFNGVVNTTDNCWNNLQNMAASCGAVIRIDNLTGKFGVFIDRAWTDAPVYAFDSTNIMGDGNVTLAELTGSPNQLEVRYARGDNQFKGSLDTQLFKLPSNLVPASAPVNQNTLTLPLCNNNIQAEVLAKLTINQYALDLGYTFRTDHRAIGIQSGDVISVTDTRKGWVAKLFRVLSTAEVERQDGFVDVEIVTKEYSDAVYVPGTLIQADPSPNITVPSPRALSAITPNAPRVTGTGIDEGQRYFNLTVDLPILNGMRVDYIEVYYAITSDYLTPPTNEQYQLLTTIKSNALDGSFAIGESVTQIINGLDKNDYVFVCKLFNTVAASFISAPSLIYQWDPQNTNIQEFYTSGTWRKPQGGQTQALIQIWGGGGGGGGSNNAGSVTSEEFLSPGNYQYTVPANISEISILAAGGGGRGGSNTPYGAGGGGSGAVAYNQRLQVFPAEVINITVGTGASLVGNVPATATTISSANFSITLNPGANGLDTQSIAGVGGQAITSGTVFIGNSTQTGSTGTIGNYRGTARGGDGADSGLGAITGIPSLGGIGGNGGSYTSTGTAGGAAMPATGSGGGGGGYNASGGAGGSGVVIIYPYATDTTAITTSTTFTLGANTNYIEITAVGGGGAGGSSTELVYRDQTLTPPSGNIVEMGVGQTYDFFFMWGRDLTANLPYIWRSTQANPTLPQNEILNLPLDAWPIDLVVSETPAAIDHVFLTASHGPAYYGQYRYYLYEYNFTTGSWDPRSVTIGTTVYDPIFIYKGQNTQEFFMYARSQITQNFAPNLYEASILKTTDGGTTWTEVIKMAVGRFLSRTSNIFAWQRYTTPQVGWTGQKYYFAQPSPDRSSFFQASANIQPNFGNAATFLNIDPAWFGSIFTGGRMDIVASGGNANALTRSNVTITSFSIGNSSSAPSITVDYGMNVAFANFSLGLNITPKQGIWTSDTGDANTWSRVTDLPVRGAYKFITNLDSNISPVTAVSFVYTGDSLWVHRSTGNLDTWTSSNIANVAVSNVSVPNPVSTSLPPVFVANNYAVQNGTYERLAMPVFTQAGRNSTQTDIIILDRRRIANVPYTFTVNNITYNIGLWVDTYLVSQDNGATWGCPDGWYNRIVTPVPNQIFGLEPYSYQIDRSVTYNSALVTSGPLAHTFGVSAEFITETYRWRYQTFYGGAGGNAAATISQGFTVTPGSTITVSIGQAGTANANVSGNGGSGGNTTVSGAIGTTITAVGGTGGIGGQLGNTQQLQTFGVGQDSVLGVGGRTASANGSQGSGGAGGSLITSGGYGGAGIVYITESDVGAGEGGGGGGGGGYLELNIPLSELNTLEDVFVGAGGAADPGNIGGGRGGNSSIRNWVATGGYGGQYDGAGGAGGTNNFFNQPDWQGGTGGDGQTSGDGNSTVKAGAGGGGGFGAAGMSIEGGDGGAGPIPQGEQRGGGGAGANPSRGAGRGGSGAVVITSF